MDQWIARTHEVLSSVCDKIETSTPDDLRTKSLGIDTYIRYIDLLTTAVDKMEKYFLKIPVNPVFITDEDKIEEYRKIIYVLESIYNLIIPLNFLGGKFPIRALSQFHLHFGDKLQLGDEIPERLAPFYIPIAQPYYSVEDFTFDFSGFVLNVISDTKYESSLKNDPNLMKIGIFSLNMECLASLVTVFHEYGHIIWGRIQRKYQSFTDKDKKKAEVSAGQPFKKEISKLCTDIRQVFEERNTKLLTKVDELTDLAKNMETTRRKQTGEGKLSESDGKNIEEFFTNLIDRWAEEFLADQLGYHMIGPSIYFSLLRDNMQGRNEAWRVRIGDNCAFHNSHPSLFVRLHQIRKQFYKKIEWEREFAQIANFDVQWSSEIQNLPISLIPDYADIKEEVSLDHELFGRNETCSNILKYELGNISKRIQDFNDAVSANLKSFVSTWYDNPFSGINYGEVCVLIEDLNKCIRNPEQRIELAQVSLQSLTLASCLGYFCVLRLGDNWPDPEADLGDLTTIDKLNRLNEWSMAMLKVEVLPAV